MSDEEPKKPLKPIRLGPDTWLEPIDGARDSIFHRKIVNVHEHPDIPVKLVVLECGHQVLFIGKDHSVFQGVVLCQHCLENRN